MLQALKEKKQFNLNARYYFADLSGKKIEKPHRDWCEMKLHRCFSCGDPLPVIFVEQIRMSNKGSEMRGGRGLKEEHTEELVMCPKCDAFFPYASVVRGG